MVSWFSIKLFVICHLETCCILVNVQITPWLLGLIYQFWIILIILDMFLLISIYKTVLSLFCFSNNYHLTWLWELADFFVGVLNVIAYCPWVILNPSLCFHLNVNGIYILGFCMMSYIYQILMALFSVQCRRVSLVYSSIFHVL